MSLGCAMFAMAQVTVDWSVESIDKPTELNSTSGTGTALDGTFILKNNGPDAVIIGDTLLYQIVVYNASNNQVMVAAPNGGFFFVLVKKIYNSGDTMQLKVKHTATVNVYPSVDVKYEVRSFVTNNARGLKLENAGASNILQKAMVWYNIQKWPVSTTTIGFNTATITPSVFHNELNVVLNKIMLNETALVNIYDMQGKLVSSNNLSTEASTRINTESLSNGMYILKVVQGSDVYTTKVVKN